MGVKQGSQNSGDDGASPFRMGTVADPYEHARPQHVTISKLFYPGQIVWALIGGSKTFWGR